MKVSSLAFILTIISLSAFSQEEPEMTPPVLPNIITPNNDGNNDRFVIGEYSIENAPSLSVMNRHGKIIFEANKYLNQWDASELETGQYFYVLKFREGNRPQYSGTLTITR